MMTDPEDSRIERAGGARSTEGPHPHRRVNSSPAPARLYTPRDLALLLSTALGDERANEVIAAALRALGLPEEPMDHGKAKGVLTHVSNADGMVGVTGRVALTRLQFGSNGSGTVPAIAPRIETRPLSVVVALLAPNVGEERAQRLVEETASTMNLGSQIELDQALALLEKITRMSGVVGVAARFAKTRIHLSW